MIYGIEAATGEIAGATSSYVPNAVHFAGGIQGQGPTYLDIASLSAGTDNGYFAFSFWSLGLTNPLNNGCTFWVNDPSGVYNPWTGTDTAPRFSWRFLTGYDTYWYAGLPAYTTWTHYLGSGETNLSAGDKIKVFYANDVLLTPDTNTDMNSAFISALNGTQFTFGDDTFGDGPTVDIADVWLGPNIKLHDGGGTIPEATRRQFIDGSGNPVDPSTWPTSAVQFYGDAASFVTNRGTGGAFSLTGVLTNASTNP